MEYNKRDRSKTYRATNDFFINMSASEKLELTISLLRKCLWYFPGSCPYESRDKLLLETIVLHPLQGRIIGTVQYEQESANGFCLNMERLPSLDGLSIRDRYETGEINMNGELLQFSALHDGWPFVDLLIEMNNTIDFMISPCCNAWTDGKIYRVSNVDDIARTSRKHWTLACGMEVLCCPDCDILLPKLEEGRLSLKSPKYRDRFTRIADAVLE